MAFTPAPPSPSPAPRPSGMPATIRQAPKVQPAKPHPEKKDGEK